MYLTAKFHHPIFNHSEVIVLINKQTNKQTPLKTSTLLRNATPVGNYKMWANAQRDGKEKERKGRVFI